ncbi:hypothetical protein BpHYR1_045556 [Brachionus plicatilis]|uniref:Uncharacterized protein n=1 Tax=Brachionus plicatilis TaxID=10195 RepID=A0A3M7QMV1_BRAPC|nr:hypothetical protein BpHYR1_045556 [Brachionus plicatilis]
MIHLNIPELFKSHKSQVKLLNNSGIYFDDSYYNHNHFEIEPPQSTDCLITSTKSVSNSLWCYGVAPLPLAGLLYFSLIRTHKLEKIVTCGTCLYSSSFRKIRRNSKKSVKFLKFSIISIKEHLGPAFSFKYLRSVKNSQFYPISGSILL